jgi:hypothetical protein
MPLPTPDDMADGIGTRWAAASINGIIPKARVYVGRVAEGVAWPNARLKVVEESRELNSGKLVLLKYRVTIECYVITAASAKSTRKALDAAFAGSNSDPSAALTCEDAAVIWSRVQPGGSSETTGERINGEDIVKVTAVYLILVEAQR